MLGYKLVTTKNGSSPIKESISNEFVEIIKKYTIELPTVQGSSLGKELLLPKQSYEQILNQVQDFLRNDSIAGDVVTIIEAIESDHVAIILEPTLIKSEE